MSHSPPTDAAEPPRAAHGGRRRVSRATRAGWFLGGLFALTAAGYVGFRIGLDRYLHSGAFLARINHATSSALQVEGEFAPLEWHDDSNARSASFQGKGTGRSQVARLSATDIAASLNLQAFWERVWELSEVKIEELDIDLKGVPDQAAETGFPGDTPDVPANQSEGGFLASLLPRETRVEKLTIERANFRFPEVQGQRRPEVRRVRLSLQPAGRRFSDGVILSGSGGEIRVPNGSRLSLLDFQARWRNGTFFISDAAADVKGSSGARVECRGEIRTSGETTLHLDVTLSGIDVDEIVTPDWRQRLSGKLGAEMAIAGPLGSTTQDGTITLGGCALQTLPVLDRLADYTGHDTFRRLPLNKATAHYARRGDVTRISDIVIESTGTLRITGSMEIADGRVQQGSLQVGVVPGVLRWIPGAEQKVFTNLSDGHLWTTMRIHGPLDELQEDLSGRLVAGAIVQTVEDAPERLIETGSDVIEKGSGLLKKGVRSGFDLIEGFVPLLGN